MATYTKLSKINNEEYISKSLDEAADVMFDSDEDSDDNPLLDPADKGQTSIPLVSCNIINCVVGSSIVGIPLAIKQSGLGLGIILLILMGVLTDYTLDLMIVGGLATNTHSYQKLLQAAFGKIGFAIVTYAQFSYPFFAMAEYNIIVGDTITKVVTRVGGETLDHSILANRHFIIFLFTLAITLPLSLYRNIGKLGKWSGISVIFVGLVTVFVIIKFFTLRPFVSSPESPWNFANINAFRGMNIMAHGYLCQHNAFLFYESLKDNTRSRWLITLHSSMFFSIANMTLFGVMGYITFADFTQGDLMENYCYTDDFANVARVLFAITVTLTFPMECFACREVIEHLFFHNHQPRPLWRHVSLTLVLVSFSVVISMATDCLGIVLELNGAFSATPLIFILPPLAYIKIREERFYSPKNTLAYLVAILGFVIMVVGVTVSLMSVIRGETCSHGRDMPYCTIPSLTSVLNNGTKFQPPKFNLTG